MTTEPEDTETGFWQPSDIDTLTDEHGTPVDEKIRPLILALWALGVRTVSSCEGHLDHEERHGGCSGPMIWIDNLDAGLVAQVLGSWNDMLDPDDDVSPWMIFPGEDDFSISPMEPDLEKVHAQLPLLVDFLIELITEPEGAEPEPGMHIWRKDH